MQLELQSKRWSLPNPACAPIFSWHLHLKALRTWSLQFQHAPLHPSALPKGAPCYCALQLECTKKSSALKRNASVLQAVVNEHRKQDGQIFKRNENFLLLIIKIGSFFCNFINILKGRNNMQNISVYYYTLRST